LQKIKVINNFFFRIVTSCAAKKEEKQLSTCLYPILPKYPPSN